MHVTFLGVGSAFTTIRYYQSNLLVTADNGKRMFIDCGSDARLSMAEWCLRSGCHDPVIDAVYISHLHADHIGGLEWLAFTTYFNPKAPKPRLYAVGEMLYPVWNHALRSGLEYIADKVTGLSDYFEPIEVFPGQPFLWQNIQFTPLRMLHVFNSVKPVYSYGLIIQEQNSEPALLFTSDTVFDDVLIGHLETWAPKVQWLFQDCETSPFQTKVHAHYNELCALPASLKKKMWLYHYNPEPTFHPLEDGFLGFVSKGQTFS